MASKREVRNIWTCDACGHGRLVSGPKNIIYTTPPPKPRPPEHIHRWAWCQRIDGAEVQRCYDCGAVR